MTSRTWLALLVLTAAAFAQSDVVFRVTTALVQIDAVVTDSKGRHIEDLSAADFEIIEDGKSRAITSFSYVRSSPPDRQSRTDRRTVRKAVPQAEPPAAPPRREDIHRTIVLVVDDLGLSFESISPVQRALRKFVEELMQPGDLVALCRTGGGSGTFQHFTNDKNVLLAAVNRLKWNPFGRAGVNVFQPVGTIPEVTLRRGSASASDIQDSGLGAQLFQDAMTTNFTVGTLGAINFVLDGLREMPGRKSVVLLSDGLSPFNSVGAQESVGLQSNAVILDSIRRLVDRANRAGAVIYSLDTRGLQTLILNAADHPRLDEMSDPEAEATLRDKATERRLSFSNGQVGLSYLASLTGGLFLGNGNRLDRGLKEVLADHDGYYLLGYKPSPHEFQTKDGRRPYHKISIKVKRKGLHVRSRTGFLGATDDETRPTYETAWQQLLAAVVSPFHAEGVHLRLTTLYSTASNGGRVVRNLLHIDARDLTFTHEEGKPAVANIGVVAAGMGGDNQQLVSISQSYRIEVSPSRLDAVLRDGVLYPIEVALPKAGAFQMRVAVRDDASERIGSASQYIDVPDLKKAGYGLTSILLDDADGSSPNSRFMGMTPAVRQFHRGGLVEYFSLLERGERVRAETLDAEVRVFRDGKEVFSTPVVLRPTDNELTLAVTGQLRLGPQMTPGQYYLQIRASSQKAKGRYFPVLQWADFEVAP